MLCIVATGSRGDVAPAVALAAALVQRGHRVRLVANTDCSELAACHGVPFGDLGFSVSDLLRTAPGQTMLGAGSAFESRVALVHAANGLIDKFGPRVVELTADATILLTTETVYLLGRTIAELRGIPQLCICFKPYGRTSAYRSFYADREDLRGLDNLASHDVVQTTYLQGLLASINPLRNRWGLPPLTAEAANALREDCPSLMAYSPAVCPRPDDWPAHRHVTGFWRCPPEDIGVPAEVRSFVEAGPPPVYIGFGSMVVEPTRLLALLNPDHRFVLATGWSPAPAPLAVPSNVCMVAGVDHAWAFPRMAAVLHHGGAGTTAAALMAGVPSLVAWFMVDQVFWAQTVERAGAGRDVGPFARLEALPGLPVRSPALGALSGRVRAKTGLATAVSLIERFVPCP